MTITATVRGSKTPPLAERPFFGWNPIKLNPTDKSSQHINPIFVFRLIGSARDL